jgi:hypothetical protein
MKTFRIVAFAGLLGMSCLGLAPAAKAQLFGTNTAGASLSSEEPAPLPVHTIEGVGGGGITPMAYLVNAGDEEHIFGPLAASLSYVNLGSKNLDALVVTDTVFQFVEFGYAANRLGLGTLPGDIRDATNVDIGESDIWLHHFNVRALLVEENTCFGGVALPAITAGFHFKYNATIAGINESLGGALTGIGYQRSNGEDFTLTATKTFPEAFGRPLIATAGLRLSEAANLGYLGFSDTYQASVEGNVVYLVADRVALAYEVRQKSSPYDEIPGLIGGEDTWQAFDVVFLLNEHKHTTLAAAWVPVGTLANTTENGGWFLQLKHEF